jgi:hypothetical protein
LCSVDWDAITQCAGCGMTMAGGGTKYLGSAFIIGSGKRDEERAKA